MLRWTRASAIGRANLMRLRLASFSESQVKRKAPRLLGRSDPGERNGGAAAAGVNGRGKSKLELLMEQDKAAKASQQARQAQAAAPPAAANGSR